jgi:hypothetical protein
MSLLVLLQHAETAETIRPPLPPPLPIQPPQPQPLLPQLRRTQKPQAHAPLHILLVQFINGPMPFRVLRFQMSAVAGTQGSQTSVDHCGIISQSDDFPKRSTYGLASLPLLLSFQSHSNLLVSYHLCKPPSTKRTTRKHQSTNCQYSRKGPTLLQDCLC